MVRAFKIIVLTVAEIWESHIGDGIMAVLVDEALGKFHILALAVLFFEVPLAIVTPAEADGALRRNIGARLRVEGDRLPVWIVAFAEIALEVGSAQEAVRHITSVLLREYDQHREVGIFTAVILEIGTCRSR